MLRHFSTLLLIVAGTVGWWITLSPHLVAYWILLVVVSLLVRLAAERRLRSAVQKKEQHGVVETRRARLKFGNRFYEFSARRCDLKAEKLLARAETAEARGDPRAAHHLRRRVDRERHWAQKSRDLADYWR